MAYLGLGANLGDPVQQLIDARAALYNLDTSLVGRCSKFYRSAPVGYDAQADFVNCVVELETSATAFELLDAVQAIEISLGRQRVKGNQNAPRTIDVDILLYANDEIDTPRLTVPHPRMLERLFVLMPLSEFAASNPSLNAYHFDQVAFSNQVVQCLSVD